MERYQVGERPPAIMGLEFGPNGHLYYVDNGQDEVVRIDPFTDEDGDGIGDEADNCLMVPNASQLDFDTDGLGDVCNEDDDNDGVYDFADVCPTGAVSWTSDALTDYDGDGCQDADEDIDDDNDRICDGTATNVLWACTVSFAEEDLCPTSTLGFTSSSSNDADRDGCEDSGEDMDDDNDGFNDGEDNYPQVAGTNSLGGVLGCADGDEDGYADQPGTGLSDDCPEVFGTSTENTLGCPDTDGDGWSNSADTYPEDATKHEAGLLSGNLLTVGVPLIVVIVLLLLVLGRRRGPSAEQAMLPALPAAPGLPVASPPTQTGPPLPPEGLPPGWTMEQWAWYGEDYLNNR